MRSGGAPSPRRCPSVPALTTRPNPFSEKSTQPLGALKGFRKKCGIATSRLPLFLPASRSSKTLEAPRTSLTNDHPPPPASPPGSPQGDPEKKRGLDWARVRASTARSYMERILAERSRTNLMWAGGAALLAVLVAFIGFWAFAIKDLPRMPDSASLWVLNRQPGVTFTDTDGKTIGIRGAFYGKSVSYKQLPPHVWQSFVAIEDRRFFEHRGVDRQGMLRAMLANLSAGGTVQGGSTITQQLVKNLFLKPERTIQRKLQEMILAGRIESRLTKDEILERYLSNVYFGDNVYGLRAASHHYFNRSPERLTLSQAAMLAGLVQAPSRLTPTRNPNAARKRTRMVLDAMAAAGFTAGLGCRPAGRLHESANTNSGPHL